MTGRKVSLGAGGGANWVDRSTGNMDLGGEPSVEGSGLVARHGSLTLALNRAES